MHLYCIYTGFPHIFSSQFFYRKFHTFIFYSVVLEVKDSSSTGLCQYRMVGILSLGNDVNLPRTTQLRDIERGKVNSAQKPNKIHNKLCKSVIYVYFSVMAPVMISFFSPAFQHLPLALKSVKTILSVELSSYQQNEA